MLQQRKEVYHDENGIYIDSLYKEPISMRGRSKANGDQKR